MTESERRALARLREGNGKATAYELAQAMGKTLSEGVEVLKGLAVQKKVKASPACWELPL